MNTFAHLHCHSNYSFLEGASRVEDLVARAAQLGMKALALTDTNGLYGVIPFYTAARAAGIRPIVGTELRRGGVRLIVLARNRPGYEKLCRIVTAFHLTGGRLRDGRRPQAHGSGNVPPPLFRALLAGGDPDIFILLPPCRLLLMARRSRSAYLEIPAAAGAPLIARLVRLASRLGIPPVATGPVLFATPGGYKVHRLLTAIRTRATLATIPPGAVALQGSHLRGEKEMHSLFADCPEAVENAAHIAAACNLEIPLGRFHLPRLTLPARETAHGCLLRRCRAGLEKRYPLPRGEAEERLRRELEVIRRLDFSSYFLVVHDIVCEARRRGIPIIGRGSAAGSIVSYCLGITHVDPIRHNLYFERFLNPERRTPPDIDLDFSWKRRDEMLGYVYRTHGADRVAMIATLVTFNARSAVREIGKALGVPPGDIDRWTASLPHTDASSIAKAAEVLPECRSLPLDREPLRTMVRLAAAIDGYPRHLGVHPGGIVITPFPLTRLVPLETAAKGVVVTQYEMHAAEAIGLVKIDLLGQRSLAVLEDALASIRENHDINAPVDEFDTVSRDGATVALIREGRTMGCFYIESPAMRQLLRKLDVTTYEELVAASSVIRPGVAESGMMRQYIDRHRGREATTFLHPRLRDVLAETHGVMIYQEDVMRVAHLVAGMTLAEADLLRRAMSGKMRSRGEMAALERKFMRAAAAQGIHAGTASEIWRQVASFAEYAFCKAHSASFALLSLQVAFLKAHWPAEFMAAVLSNGGGFYHAQAYLDEAHRLGLTILPPDINRSEIRYTAGPGWIRVGLMQVKGLRQDTMERVMSCRGECGSYSSLADFLERVRPERREAEGLILCGAFDPLGLPRPTLLRELYLFSDGLAAPPVRRFADAQLLPLAVSPRRLLSAPDARAGDALTPDYTDEEKRALERAILGVSATCHPLASFMEKLGPNGYVRADELSRHAGECVELIGWLVCTKRVRTSKGEYMRFITMEDTTALFEVVLFPRPYRRFGHLLTSPGPFAVRGRAVDDGGVVVLNADRLKLVGQPMLTDTHCDEAGSTKMKEMFC
jgi:DNA-directed DNA polymerase III PolC